MKKVVTKPSKPKSSSQSAKDLVFESTFGKPVKAEPTVIQPFRRPETSKVLTIVVCYIMVK